MKKIYRICMIIILSLSAPLTIHAQDRVKAFPLGKTQSLKATIRGQLNTAANAKGKPSLLLNVSEKEILNLLVNVQHAADDNSEYVVGEVKGHEASSFFIRI